MKKIKGSFKFLACLFLTVWIYGCAQPSYDETISAMKEKIPQIMEEESIVGLAVALVDCNRVVWAEGFGFVDKEVGIKADSDSLFEIGSVSKTMTAMSVMKQVEKGNLSLDDRLNDVLAGFTINPSLRTDNNSSQDITIHSMLTHHSGIPGDLFNGGFAREYYPDYNDRLLKWLSLDYASYPPGLYLSYSNTATSLLADVVESVSGSTFEEVTGEIFGAMDMVNTYFYIDPQSYGPGYLEGKPIESFYCNIPAAGSVVSTADDMAKYMITMLNKGKGNKSRVLEKKSVEEMFTQQNSDVELDLDFSIGLIWILWEPELEYAGKVVWHNGATILFRSHLILLLDHGLGVFVVSNSMEAGDSVKNIAIETLQSALREKKGLIPPEKSETLFPPVVELPSEKLTELEGFYSSSHAKVIQIQMKDNGLNMTENPWKADSVTTFLVPRENGNFSKPDSLDIQYSFEEISGRSVIVIHKVSSMVVLADRYELRPIPGAWLDRLGKWAAVDLDPADFSMFMPEPSVPEFELIEENGMLLMSFDDEEMLILSPVSDNRAFTWGTGRNMGMAVQAVEIDGVEQIRYRMNFFQRSEK